jgi:hypothetical protein
MKKRFSSLNLTDLAAWSMAVGAFALLAGAGLMTGPLRKRDRPRAFRSEPSARRDSNPNLTTGI